MSSGSPAAAITAVALALVTAASFAPALEFGFLTFDDLSYVEHHELVNRGITVEGLRRLPSAVHMANWHPLTWLSHMLDFELFGFDARGHHATSVVLHTANAALLFLALRALTGALAASALAAVIFAVHPLRAESVAWISERKDVLSSFFGIASLALWAAFIHRGSALRYVGAWLLFAASLASKASWIALPFVMVLLDVWPLRRQPGFAVPGLARSAAEKLPFFALSAVSAAISFATQSGVQVLEPSFAARLARAAEAYLGYLAKTVWPTDLAALYPLAPVDPTTTLAGGAALLAITGLCFWARHRLPWLLVGWLWFAIALLPVSGLVPLGYHAMADRYTYFPGMGLALAFAWSVHALSLRWDRRGVSTLATAALLGALLVAPTREQVSLWRDERTLFTHTIRVTPPNYFARTGLGIAILRAGDPRAALPHLERALELNPDYSRAVAAYARAQLELDDLPRARDAFLRALDLDPALPGVRAELGSIFETQGRVQAAVTMYEQELALNPTHLRALLRLAEIRGLDDDPAVRDPARAVELAMRANQLTGYMHAEALAVLADALAARGRTDEAVAYSERAERLARAAGDGALAGSLAERRARYAEPAALR